MKFFFLLSVIFYFHTRVYSQNRTTTLSLYYSINEITSKNNINKLDSLGKELGTSTATIDIYGYADFLNNDSYNLALSQKRADAVKSYLQKKEKEAKILIRTCKGEGEKNSTDNQSPEGEATQRRVDVIISQERTIKKIGTRENKVQVEEKKNTLQPLEDSAPEKKIEELKVGESLEIEGLSFIPGRHMVTQSAVPVMKKLLQTLKEHPEIKVEIQGHVCCPGDGRPDGLDYDTHVYNLSESRAKAIYDFLIHNGIDKERLEYKGYGRTKPKIAIETTPEEEQINRRVEIKILEN